MSVLKRYRRQLKGAKVPINGSWEEHTGSKV